MTTTTRCAALLCGMILVTASCSRDDTSTTPTPTPAPTQAPAPPSVTATPSPQPPSPQPTPLGLAVVGLDGTVRGDLALPTDAWTADLSADGTRLAFLTTSTKVGFCGGCAIDADRLAVLRLGTRRGVFMYGNGRSIREISEPAWSPDGTQIAFAGIQGRSNNRDIFVATLLPDDAPIASARILRLTTDDAVDEFAAWSPDGATILFDNGGSEPVDDSGFSPTQEIWSVPAHGGSPRRLTHNTTPDAQPDVASDGTVAFWRDGEIWTMDQDGRHQHRLAAVPSNAGFNPRWSPDGTMLALLRYDDSERATFASPHRPSDLPLMQVVIVKLATGRVITVGPRVASDVNPVSWTPDGSALLIDRYDAGA